MALGGGNFSAQNKVIPGTYINVLSLQAPATPSERGVCAVPLIANWGEQNKLIIVDRQEAIQRSMELFGYDYASAEMRDIREVFRNARRLVTYRTNGDAKATATIGGLTATAKYAGTRGNDIRLVIETNVDDPSKSDVETRLGSQLVDSQTVETIDDLVNNSFVDFTGTGAFTTSAGTSLTGGTNKSSLTGSDFTAFLGAIESQGVNTVACPSTDPSIKNLFIQYARDKRDAQGIKIQVVVYKNESADYEGVISVDNPVTTSGADAFALVYWVAGASAGIALNQSLTNKPYTGEYTIDVNRTQATLEANISDGKFVFHRVGDEIHVLVDINTLTTFTTEKNSDFANNQVIRIVDGFGTEIATIFNTQYIGNSPNLPNNRSLLANDIISVYRRYIDQGALAGFNPADLSVNEGDTKDAVDIRTNLDVAVAMAKLYVTLVLI